MLFGVAAISDFFDGKVARLAGVASERGQLLDNMVDVLFVESAFVCFAAWGLLSWIVPLVVGASVGAYAYDSWRRARFSGTVQLDRSRVGHAAGVCNYALVGLVAAQLGWPATLPGWSISAAGCITAGLNMVAVLFRVLPASGALSWPR